MPKNILKLICQFKPQLAGFAERPEKKKVEGIVLISVTGKGHQLSLCCCCCCRCCRCRCCCCCFCCCCCCCCRRRCCRCCSS